MADLGEQKKIENSKFGGGNMKTRGKLGSPFWKTRDPASDCCGNGASGGINPRVVLERMLIALVSL